MFKIESYITPIILSYVNRYVNNFKLQDSQVSLWDGDATFHNLELNLDVLEEELQLPFSFVSGNIRELSIHVPWTKIASEPIKITINTIECILNLKGKEPDKTSQKKKGKEKKVVGQSKDIEAPPGYIQSLVNKIVSNISIHCNNLILKYVEEDIVLSVNVKLLKFESANNKWEASFTDLSPSQVILRKIISVNDLTLCLDKRNASGKIEVYQDPMLYRCSMVMHMLRNYHSATASKASITRIDVHCNNMEFSITEQQVPMVMRLLMLLYALQQKHLIQDSDSITIDPGGSMDSKEDLQENSETWTNWAWSYVSSVLPVPWDEDWSDQDLVHHSGHTLQFGFYVDSASVTFKISEAAEGKAFYSHKKIRHSTMLTLHLQGLYCDTLIHGFKWFNCTGGISEAILIPVGSCSCGLAEVNDGSSPYLKIGTAANFHKNDSLFDADAVENNGGKRIYNTSWDNHMTINTESVLLERTPAFAFDYLYQMEISDDFGSDVLSDLDGSNEYSNVPESSALRFCIGPLCLRVCSGLLHRLNTLYIASSFYDYPPYYKEKPDSSIQNLLPPSEEDFDALNEFIPTRSIRVTFIAPAVELELMDHPFFEPKKGCLFRKVKKMPNISTTTSTSVLPKLSIECQFIDISTNYPMYINRLVHTTCQLPDPPAKLFDGCYLNRSIKVVGLLSRLIANPMCKSTILTPTSLAYSSKRILKPQYWTNANIPHEEFLFECESCTLNGTKAKMLIVVKIIEKLLTQEPDQIGKSIYSSTLLTDACRDYGFPYMEICIECMRFKKVNTNSTATINISTDSIKAFIFEHVYSEAINHLNKPVESNNIQQVLFISGPESKHSKEKKDHLLINDLPLFTATIQFPLDPNVQKHPPILIFNLQEIRICVDPLLCKWILYIPKNFLISNIFESSSYIKPKILSLSESSRKLSSQKIESVHSSSDREQFSMPLKSSQEAIKKDPIDIHERVYNLLKTWFGVWKGMYLYGDISQCNVYFPLVSLSAIGSQGIDEAFEQAMNQDNPPDVMVITLPFTNIRSAQKENIKKYLTVLPISLPEKIWSTDKFSFPWTISISELSCYTIQQRNKLIFLKPVSLSATVGLSTRPAKSSATGGTDSNIISDTNQISSISNEMHQKKKLPKTLHVPKDKKSSTSRGSRGSSEHSHSSFPTEISKDGGCRIDFSQKQQVKQDYSSKIDLDHLGVCIHIDMSPIHISTSEVQVYLFASILYGLMEIITNFLPISPVDPKSSKASKVNVPDLIKPVEILREDSNQSLKNPNQGTTLENSSLKTPPLSMHISSNATNFDSVKLTAWIQWTIARFTFELLSDQYKDGQKDDSNLSYAKMKLVLDAEDIVSSLDFQSVYLKIKSKIGFASIKHYERSSLDSEWQPGSFSGIVMQLREDMTMGQKQEDNGLISLIITRASCQHTHSLWGTTSHQHHITKENKKESKLQSLTKSRYITEIVINVQPLDFIVSLNTMRSFYLVLIPLFNIPLHNSNSAVRTDKTLSESGNFLSSINNQNMPLTYLECQDIRLIMPAHELLGNDFLHDTMIFQLHKISLTPHAVNPICRTPLRSDIYDQAAHARILNIPGSDLEDRQYQLDLAELSLCTGTWEDINSIFSPKNNNSSLSNLRGMSENPALEWNIIDQGQPNIVPSLNLRNIIEKFNISIIAAPAMIYQECIIVCGHSLEMNLVSDIFIKLSLHQIKMISALLTEFLNLVTPLIIENGVLKRPKIVFPYSRFYSKISIIDSERECAIIIEKPSKDSGIETSDVKSVPSTFTQVKKDDYQQIYKEQVENDKHQNSSYNPPSILFPPLEMLFTAGKIALCVYCVDNERNVSVKCKTKGKNVQRKITDDLGYDASEESTDEKNDNYTKYIPYFYVCFTQPNAFFVQQQLEKKLQMSIFNINLQISGPEYALLNHMPTENDYPINMLETKKGNIDPSSGIPPAFFNLKFIQGINRNAKLELDISKPTKIICKMTKWLYLLTIKDKILDSFKQGGGDDSLHRLLEAVESNKQIASIAKPFESYTQFQKIRNIFGNINSIRLKTDQLILSLISESDHELQIAMQHLQIHFVLYNRPEKIILTSNFDSITVTSIYNNFKMLLLNPWNVHVDISLYWELWQDLDSNPQIQISIDSGFILVDVTTEHLKCIEMIRKNINECFPFLSTKSTSRNNQESLSCQISDRDQYYKDDLRAGAFQFVDSYTDSADEMPLPYQVMFWSNTIEAMAWKYPQPRALTKIRVFPVPFKMAFSSQDNIIILCRLEYWSECRNSYLPYTDFYLSENEVCHLNLPKGNPKTIVASVWRVIIIAKDINTGTNISKLNLSRSLAACMRIDSYFNTSLIPSINLSLHITKLQLSLFNYFPKNVSLKLPAQLQKYTIDWTTFPETQRFLNVSMSNLTSYFTTWHFNDALIEINGTFHSDILNYAVLSEQPFIHPFNYKLELCLSNSLICNFKSLPVQLVFSPSHAHTLAVSSQLWLQQFNSGPVDLNFITLTRIVICNDTNVCIRYGQDNTDESVSLDSRKFQLYAWRSQKKKQRLRVAIQETDWTWSQPFSIIQEGIQVINVNVKENVAMFVSVKCLSQTQKQITFSGQLIVANMLAEHFELKIVEDVNENKELEFRKASNHIIASKCTSPSMFFNNKKRYFLRLRFYGLESAWTGDIPMKEHSIGSEPWLVKVPLQERSQFLSIWCRIIIQDHQRVKRILAVLWPLFMVKSNLPFSTKIHIETPTLGAHLDSVINGKGEIQQLYCPGTSDHSHQITFQLEDGNSGTNNTYVPLNYTLVDTQKFFKKSTSNNIEAVLDSLSCCFEAKWPYLDDELERVEWIVEENQPLTHVQVRYQNAAPFSCTLLAELLPWCLMLNTFGAPLSIVLNGIELCKIKHHHIIAPPKLEQPFHLSMMMANKLYFSNLLQLAKSDWSQSFYMPKIAGTIPINGVTRSLIKCGTHLSVVNITSSISNEIRLLRFSSTHVLSNHLSLQIHVIGLAVPDAKEMYAFPNDLGKYCFTIAPQLRTSHVGIPVVQWYMAASISDNSTDYALYIAFSVDPSIYGWSCPIRVDKPQLRRAFTLRNSNISIPVVLTAQENKEQMYLSIYNDSRPQIFIQNKSNVNLYCGQSLPDDTGVMKEAEHLLWVFKVDSATNAYYNMPLISEKYPELPQVAFSEKLSLAYSENDTINVADLNWSAGVNVANDNSIFIRIPNYGDIKLIVENTACVTLVTIESVSEVEINARDIRVRLTMRDNSVHGKLIKDSINDNISIRSSTSFTLADDNSTILTEHQSIKSNLSSLSIDPIPSSFISNQLSVTTLPLKSNWKCTKLNFYVESFSLKLLSEVEIEDYELWELVNLTCDDIVLMAVQTQQQLNVKILISEIQLDNQLYTRESFDFPVVLTNQDKKMKKVLNILNTSMEELLDTHQQQISHTIELVMESWKCQFANKRYTGVKSLKIYIVPIACFIENIYITRLMKYLKNLNIVNLVMWPNHRNIIKFSPNTISINIPELIAWECALLSQPLTIRTFILCPVSMSLSVHSSVKLYIALDQSPLQFSKFERRRLFTSSYRLGHAITMHYLSGAIFGAGWVVGSLELLGSPGGLARAMGSGLRDFVSLPYRGLVQGPMAFLKGVTTGSASLMRHVTAGTLQSMTKLASSVARNLDRLTLDEEHQKRTEEQRRQRPQGVAQGFVQGLTALGISLLGAVGGIAHHPLQSVMSDSASPKSLAAGVGLGLVGVFTKPLSGAAELLALTGQGLLQGAGWNSLPDPRSHCQTLKINQTNNSLLKYSWKFTNSLVSNILYMTEAIHISEAGDHTTVALILLLDSIIIVNVEEDTLKEIVPLKDIHLLSSNKDSTILSLRRNLPGLPKVEKSVDDKIEDELSIQMDPEMRARVFDYVRSTVGFLNLTAASSFDRDVSLISSPDEESNLCNEFVIMNFCLSAENKEHFSCLLSIVQMHNNENNFPML